MYTLPIEIKINEDTLHIRERGDFRVILDCFSALQDMELEMEYRIAVALFIFYEDFESIQDTYNYPYLEDAVTAMFNFFVCNEKMDEDKQDKGKLIDWEADSQLIASAINKVAGKEIRAEKYVHWWTFIGYYNAVGTSVLSTVVQIRKKIVDGKKLEKHEQEFKKENPHYFNRDFRSPEQQLMDKKFRELWNRDK